MTSPLPKGKSSRWGSLLSGAVAGLESRLDTILTDDNQASAKSREADRAAAEAKARQQTLSAPKVESQNVSRSSSRSKATSSLQDRLARAVATDSSRSASVRPSVDLGSRPATPVLVGGSPRASTDSKRSIGAAEKDSAENIGKQEVQGAGSKVGEEAEETSPAVKPEVDIFVSQDEPPIPEPVTLPQSAAAAEADIEPVRQSIESTHSDLSLEVHELTPSEAPEPQLPRPLQTDIPSISQAEHEEELARLQLEHQEELARRQEEMHAHLERIDALQAKLQYLSKEVAVTARQAAQEASAGSLEKKLAEREEQIALLMQEGQNLSKTEAKHMATIRQLRSKAAEEKKEVTEIKQKLEKSEKQASTLADRLQRAEAAERQAQERMKQLGRIEKEVDGFRSERESAKRTIDQLRRELDEAKRSKPVTQDHASKAELEAERKRAEDLEEQLGNLKIEKKLSEDRARVALREAKEDAERSQEKARAAEIDLRSEIANLESKIEVLRTRTEEASSSATGDSQAKLLRQIETLQTQYALASENWQGIESTLTARVTALEKERDEASKRESEVRRKARDVNTKARRFEDELEALRDRCSTLESDLQEARTQADRAQKRATEAESSLEKLKRDVEREKKHWEEETQQKIEEERTKWRLEQPQNHYSDTQMLRTESPTASYRKPSVPDHIVLQSRRAGARTASADLLNIDRPTSRRSSTQPLRTPDPYRSPDPNRTPELGTPARQDSFPYSLSHLNTNGIPPTPSINTQDHDDMFERGSSPHRTVNDMISASTAGAGPSVQLVERMSASVRRLESEKAASKEEMARLLAQRDEARGEVVELMKEVEQKRLVDSKVEKLERELKDLDQRYQASLEMLGEKSEQVEELKADVADLKKIYRELVDRTLK